MTPREHSTKISSVSITDAAKIDKIVQYSFDRGEKSNVLAIHQTRPIIAYLITIQRNSPPKSGSKPGVLSPAAAAIAAANAAAAAAAAAASESPGSSSINGAHMNQDKNKTVSIRIMDYVSGQRCLAKGVYYARPADCAFTVNSLLCSQAEIIKLAIVDKLANVYLCDISYFINEITATRIAVIRGPGQEMSPLDSISLVWCPFVPCEDYYDGDGGLRLALSTGSRVELFAVDRLQGKTGEFQRSDLRGAYKSIQDVHKSDIATLSLSPDCSTVSAAGVDNRVTFYTSDINDGGQRCLHSWEASSNITDKSVISKLFFLDDYPKLLADSTMKFWGSAFIGTRSGQMMLMDLRTWSVYQHATLSIGDSVTQSVKNFDYRIDITARNIVAMNGNQCFVVQIEHQQAHDGGPAKENADLPRLVRISNLCSPSRSDLHINPIYSFVIKHSKEDELELFTISACSLERYIIDLKALKSKATPLADPAPRAALGADGAPLSGQGAGSAGAAMVVAADGALMQRVDTSQMDRMVECLFTRLNSAFSQGLDEFLSDIKCEVNDLKQKLDGLCRDVKKLQHQLHAAAK